MSVPCKISEMMAPTKYIESAAVVAAQASPAKLDFTTLGVRTERCSKMVAPVGFERQEELVKSTLYPTCVRSPAAFAQLLS